LTAAIVGCGPRGIDHAVAIGEVDGVSLAAFADLVQARRERAQAEFGVPAYGEASEMLSATNPEIVVVATPHDVRGELIGRIATGESVSAIVVEKPLALSMTAAEEMVAACDRAGVQLSVGYQLRFVPHFIALKEAIDSGELGSIEFIRGLSYGHLLDQGPHLVDAVRALTGGRRVLWAMSQRGAALTPADAPGDRDGLIPDISAWTTHHLALEGGVRCALETGPLHQRGDRYGQGAEEIDDYLDKRMTVIGSRGIAQFVAGGDCRILTDDDDGWRTHAGGVARYVSANRAFHEEVRDGLLHGTPHRCDAHDSLDSLEGLLACARSLTDGDAVTLPLEREGRAATLAVGPKPTLEASVILPIPDHRGYAEQAVRSWTEGQTFDRGRYEVLVAVDGVEPGLDELVQRLLGPGDRLIRKDCVHEIELYDKAARAARGRVLLLTEPHCIAEPTCIEEFLAHLARTGEVGGFGRSVGINANALARMEETLYEEGIRPWVHPDHWCKVILRATAIDRQVFLDVGGFETAYGRFAEFALAAKLHASGKRLGHAPGAAVQHVYTTSFSMLEPHIEDFLDGELAYRLDYPPEYCERYFGAPREWVERRVLTKEGARAAWGVAFRALLRPAAWRYGSARPLLDTLRRLSPAALLGPRPALARANLSYALARLRCRLWWFSERRQMRAYRDAWDGLTGRSRLRDLAALPPERSAAPARPPFALADISDERLLGFHATERFNGTTFRWSRSVALAEVPVNPGAYQVEIDTGGLRDPRDVGLQVFFNGRRIPRSHLNVDPRRIAFPVEPGQFSSDANQRVGFVSVSFQPSREADSPDTRELGLPVSSIDFRPVAEPGGG
jgi:predicted dehydrogenase